MGASTFEETAWGVTPQEAFRSAVEEAREEYGSRGYTGSLAEKGDFVMIPLPKQWADAPREYADHLIEMNDPRVDNKWGPAGCILLESKPMKDEVVYATTQERYEQKGARKWETYFEITKLWTYGQAGEVVGTATSQTEAEKFAKDWVKKHNHSVSIRIGKRLVNGEQNIIKIHPKTKEVPSKKTMNKYLFFGWASS